MKEFCDTANPNHQRAMLQITNYTKNAFFPYANDDEVHK